jgi:hydrogenase maturation protease
LALIKNKNMGKILVLGVGNLLLGDEGLGVQSIEYLKNYGMPDDIDVLDGGTGGFHLLSLMDEYEKMILIDATIDEKPIGSLKVVYPKFSKDYPRALTTHDIGLKDLIETASVLNIIPEIILIAITIAPHQEIGMVLSPEIEAVLPLIGKKVLELATAMRENAPALG